MVGLVGVGDREECMTAVHVALLPIVPEVVALPVLLGSQEADSEC